MIVINQTMSSLESEKIQPKVISSRVLGFPFSAVSWIRGNSRALILKALDAGLGEGASEAFEITVAGVHKRNIRAVTVGLLGGVVIGGASYLRKLDPELNDVMTAEEYMNN